MTRFRKLNLNRMGAALLFVLFSAGVLSCRQVQVPENLIGYWITDQGRCHRCFIDIEPDRITLGKAGKITASGRVEKVYYTIGDSHARVTIRYRNRNEPVHALRLVCPNPGQDAIWLENQPDILWKRSPDHPAGY